MNKMAEEALTKIYNDPELREEFICQNTLESMYGYCSSVLGGYTKEEFSTFVSEMYDYASKKCAD